MSAHNRTRLDPLRHRSARSRSEAIDREIGILAPVLGIAPDAPQTGENRRLLIENAGLNSIAATQATRGGTLATTERLTRWHIIGTAGG
jgi:hypothetical protein